MIDCSLLLKHAIDRTAKPSTTKISTVEEFIQFMRTVPKITAQRAQAIANSCLSDHLPDRFTADQPFLSEDNWRVPVILTYPRIGSLGEVGEIWVSAVTEVVLSHTEFAEIRAAGLHLYETRQNDIEAAFS